MLNFTNLAFFSLVAKMEYCYSKLATPDNLYTYGGLVLGCICDEIASHDNFIEHFESLFCAGAYDVETVNTSFRYYVKVFGNLRAKDLARKYNARLYLKQQLLVCVKGLRRKVRRRNPTNVNAIEMKMQCLSPLMNRHMKN